MNPALYLTLKAVALADQTAAALLAIGNDPGLAAWFNAVSTVYVWRTDAPVDEVFDAIAWANLTPADVADDTAIYTNRALLCQAKQINLQILLQGKDQVNGGKASIRSGLSDALLNVPSAAGGATQSAGWAAVKTAITRFATRAEAPFSIAKAVGAGTLASPYTLDWEGVVSSDDASYIRMAV
jgi:hypothetical protein